MKHGGVIANWNEERGFGFIRPAGGGSELFFHISDYGGTGRPASGEAVNFRIGKGRDGKPAAIKVTPASARASPKPDLPSLHERANMRVWLAGSLIALGLLVAILGRGPVILAIIYLAMGIASFALYWLDKRSAQAGGWRVPESSLHFLDLTFGIAGGLLAQQMLRHKTSKQGFAQKSYLIAFGHLALLLALLLGLDISDAALSQLLS